MKFIILLLFVFSFIIFPQSTIESQKLELDKLLKDSQTISVACEKYKTELKTLEPKKNEKGEPQFKDKEEIQKVISKLLERPNLAEINSNFMKIVNSTKFESKDHLWLMNELGKLPKHCTMLDYFFSLKNVLLSGTLLDDKDKTQVKELIFKNAINDYSNFTNLLGAMIHLDLIKKLNENNFIKLNDENLKSLNDKIKTLESIRTNLQEKHTKNSPKKDAKKEEVVAYWINDILDELKEVDKVKIEILNFLKKC